MHIFLDCNWPTSYVWVLISMSVVNCRCSSCEAHLFVCVNEWTQVNNDLYACPKVLLNQAIEVGLSAGQRGLLSYTPLLEGCLMQILHCKACQKGVGLQCVEAPEGKTQYRCALSVLVWS